MSSWKVLAATAKLKGGSHNYPQVGSTTHFQIFAQRKLGQAGIDIANRLLAECEGGYAKLLPWFTGVLPVDLPFHVYVSGDVDGAKHFGCTDTEIYVGTNTALHLSAKGYALLLAAEMVEVFAASGSESWDCGSNTGEGLSRVLANAVYPNDEIKQLATATRWLDDTADNGMRRENWVEVYDPSDQNPLSIGCAVLFLNWLRFVRNHDWADITSAGGDTLADVFHNLKEPGNAWQIFSADIEARYPLAKKANLKTDNPFREA